MSNRERWNARDGSYSAWHRSASLARFLDLPRDATACEIIDIDYIEYDWKPPHEPLAFIETAQDVGQPHKHTYLMEGVAKRTSPIIPLFCTLYTLGDTTNPFAPDHRDITAFRYKQIYPHRDMEWIVVTPKEYAEFIFSLHAHTV